jgi:PAS domain S-box-containing protein
VPLSGIDVEKHAISWQTYRLDGTVMPSEELPLSRAILKGETVRNEEVIIRHSSGEDHYVSANAAPIRNAEGEITAGIVVFHDITENKRAARALAESTQKFQLIVENMSDGFWLMDLDLKTTWISPSIIRHRGYTLEEIQTLPIESQFIPESAQLVEKIIEEELTPERLANPLIKLSRTVELGFLCKDGSVIWTDTTYSVIRDSDGKPQAILGVGHDITDKKRAEEERKASEKNYRELFTLLRLLADNMPDMLWAKNLNKEFIFANKAICSNLLDARDTEEPIGKTDLFFAMRQRNTQPDNPEWHTFGEICQDSDTATLQAMKPMQFDEFGNVNGKFLFLDVYKAPLYDEKGQLIGLVGSARDVTATKEAENQLRKLSLAVEQSPASVVITNLEGTIEYVNPKFSEVTGYSSEEAIGKNPNILKSGKLPDEVYAGFWETISSGSVWKGEFHNKKKNGELFWESVSVSPIKNENGEISHYLAVKEDITDSKRSEIARKIQYNIARSIHTAKSETELLGIISQELGQLLDFSIFFAARYQSDQGTLQQLTCGDETGEMDEWNVRTSVSGQVIRSGKTIFLRGGEIAAFCMQHNLMIPEPAPACWLGVPMVINNQVGGVMVIQHDSNPAGISKADVSLLEMIAHETGIYLEKQLMIEDLIVAKEKAEESDRLKTHFLNNISHEIRTPLNGIMGFSDLILDESLSQEEKKHYHHILQQSSNRLQQTITDIIDIAELKAGTISLTPENMEVRQVLARLTDKFRYACSRKNVILSLEVDPVEEKTFLKTDKEPASTA